MHSVRRSAPIEIFDSTKTSLKGLLEDIRTGNLQLPNFQRSWGWTDDRIKSLLESIAMNHPIGAAMFLETGGTSMFEFRAFDGVKPEDIEGKVPTTIALDGQQRLTSAFQSCLSDAPVKINSYKRTQYRRYFFDIGKAVYVAIPLSEAIISIATDANGKPLNTKGDDYSDPYFQFENGFFPVDKIFCSEDWEEGHSAHWDNRPSAERSAALMNMRDFRKAIVKAFEICMLPIIVLKRGIDAGGICLVYEKLNSEGMSLDAFDLLIAHYAALGYNLRGDWFGDVKGVGLAKQMEEKSKGLLKGLTPKQFMQGISMLSGAAAGLSILRTTKNDIMQLPLSEYTKYKDAMTRGFLNAAQFMQREKILTRTLTPSFGVITALATILSNLEGQTDNHITKGKLKQWFWCVVYSNHYGSNTDQVLATDVPAVIKWLTNGEKQPRSVSETDVLQRKIALTSKRSSSSMHNAIATSIIRTNATDFGTGEPIATHHYTDDGYDIHHIFPTKWCQQNGIPLEQAESIVNKTPMSMRTNRQIGGRAPSDYLKAIEERSKINGQVLDSYIRTHGIDPEALRNDDFQAFFEKRLQHLSELVSNDIGKDVIVGGAEIDESDELPDLPEDATWFATCRDGIVFLKKEGLTYIALPGSIMTNELNRSLSPFHLQTRQAIIEGKFAQQLPDSRWILEREYDFQSPTAAVAALLGRSGGGSWKDRDGLYAKP
jgi:hypothetical protein